MSVVTKACETCEGYGYIEVAHGIHPANVTESPCPAECDNGEVVDDGMAA